MLKRFRRQPRSPDGSYGRRLELLEGAGMPQAPKHGDGARRPG
jgi:hypothetical protein